MIFWGTVTLPSFNIIAMNHDQLQVVGPRSKTLHAADKTFPISVIKAIAYIKTGRLFRWSLPLERKVGIALDFGTWDKGLITQFMTEQTGVPVYCLEGIPKKLGKGILLVAPGSPFQEEGLDDTRVYLDCNQE